jgi:hypothetical protein
MTHVTIKNKEDNAEQGEQEDNNVGTSQETSHQEMTMTTTATGHCVCTHNNKKVEARQGKLNIHYDIPLQPS